MTIVTCTLDTAPAMLREKLGRAARIAVLSSASVSSIVMAGCTSCIGICDPDSGCQRVFRDAGRDASGRDAAGDGASADAAGDGGAAP